MSKRKSVTLLSIISVLMAFLLVMSFIRFPIGVKDYNSLLGAVKLDYDIAGGVAYTLTLNDENENEVTDIDKVVETIESRLEKLGHTAYMVKPIKNADEQVVDKQIRIEIADSQDADTDISAAVSYGALKIYGGQAQDPTTRILEGVKFIKTAKYDGETDQGSVLTFELTTEGRTAVLEAIGSSSEYYLKMTCGVDDHGNEVAVFNSSFTKSLLDNNNYTLSLTVGSEAQAKQMALLFTEGGIDYRYDISEGVEITSPYGKNVGLKSVVAILTLIIVAIIVFVLAYKGLSAMLSLALTLFILIEGWMLIAIPGIVVNMGSIVGIIASTLVCVISMIALAQRIKEEFANSKKTAKAAINKGFNQSLVPTINLHVVAGVVALCLFIFATGVVKGFAITFGIGVIASIISTLAFTRMFNSIILPLVNDKEKFLGFKREKAEDAEV